jgi:hypothetical protein
MFRETSLTIRCPKGIAMTLFIEGIEYVTAAEAAATLNTTPLRVMMLVKQKELVGQEVDGSWYISRPSLACATAHGTDRMVANGCQSYCKSSGCGCR